jgi:hypothetical protein
VSGLLEKRPTLADGHLDRSSIPRNRATAFPDYLNDTMGKSPASTKPTNNPHAYVGPMGTVRYEELHGTEGLKLIRNLPVPGISTHKQFKAANHTFHSTPTYEIPNPAKRACAGDNVKKGDGHSGSSVSSPAPAPTRRSARQAQRQRIDFSKYVSCFWSLELRD